MECVCKDCGTIHFRKVDEATVGSCRHKVCLRLKRNHKTAQSSVAGYNPSQLAVQLGQLGISLEALSSPDECQRTLTDAAFALWEKESAFAQYDVYAERDVYHIDLSGLKEGTQLQFCAMQLQHGLAVGKEPVFPLPSLPGLPFGIKSKVPHFTIEHDAGEFFISWDDPDRVEVIRKGVRHGSGFYLKIGDVLRAGCPLEKNPCFLEMTLEGTRRKEPDLLIRESLDSDLVRRVGLIGLLLSNKTGWNSWKGKIQKIAPNPPSSNWSKDYQTPYEWEGLRNLLLLLEDCDALDSVPFKCGAAPSLQDQDLKFWFARLCRATARVYFGLDGFKSEESPCHAGIYASLQWLVSDFARCCETGLKLLFEDQHMLHEVDSALKKNVELQQHREQEQQRQQDHATFAKSCWLRVENECVTPEFDPKSGEFDLSRQNLKVDSTSISRKFPAKLHRRGLLFELVPSSKAKLDDVNILLNGEPLRCFVRLLNSGDVISFGNVDQLIHVTFVNPCDSWSSPSPSDIPRAKELTQNLVWAGEVITNQTKENKYSTLGNALDAFVHKKDQKMEQRNRSRAKEQFEPRIRDAVFHFSCIVLAGPGNSDCYSWDANRGEKSGKNKFQKMLRYFRNIETHFPTGMRKQPRDPKMELWYELLLKFLRYFSAGFADAVPGLKNCLLTELRLTGP